VKLICVKINNGKFSVEEATKVAQKYYGANEAMMKKAKDLIDVCAKKGMVYDNIIIIELDIFLSENSKTVEIHIDIRIYKKLKN